MHIYTDLCISALHIPAAIHTSRDIDKYLLKTYMFTKLIIHAIYAKYLIDSY